MSRNVVQETSDYAKFKLIGSNRDTVRGHVEALKKAFAEQGNLTRVQPILVNEKFEIIDGQHRFVACEELGEPIFYTQVPGLTIEDARKMNILHRSWTTDDYAQSYALMGYKEYQKYLVLKEDYEVGHSIILAHAMGEVNGTHKAFREGNLVIQDFPGARQSLDRLTELMGYSRLFKTEKLARAVRIVEKADGYDHRQMVHKVEQFGDRYLRAYGLIEDNLRMLEEIYNYKSKATRLRLY